MEIGLESAVREMVGMVQRADREELRNAVIITAKSETPGFVRHYWFCDVNHPDLARDIAELEAEDGRVKDRATLEQIVLGVIEGIQKKFEEIALAGADAETN